MVDGFDFGPEAAPGEATDAAAAAPAGADAADAALASLSPDFVGPPSVQLAPRAIDPRAAFMVRSLLRDVVARGTGTAARVLGRADIGGKTGSTNDYRDAWFSGFGGPLVTTVWVGRDDFSTLGSREYGGRAALPVWIDYMRAALDGVEERAEPLPEGLVQVPVDPTSGLPVAPGTPGARPDYFRVEDLDRIAAQGLRPAVEAEQQEAFDIF
jgi:penicillin-binding protein 1A